MKHWIFALYLVSGTVITNLSGINFISSFSLATEANSAKEAINNIVKKFTDNGQKVDSITDIKKIED